MDNPYIEGTWEEVLTHAPELEGQRVRVTVLPDKGVSAEHSFDELIGAINSKEAPHHISNSTSFSDGVVHKLAHQGIHLP